MSSVIAITISSMPMPRPIQTGAPVSARLVGAGVEVAAVVVVPGCAGEDGAVGLVTPGTLGVPGAWSMQRSPLL